MKKKRMTYYIVTSMFLVSMVLMGSARAKEVEEVHPILGFKMKEPPCNVLAEKEVERPHLSIRYEKVVGDLPVYKVHLSEYEQDLLARLIHAEVGIESFKSKVYVGSVILNRVDSDKFPDSIKSVIYERKPQIQFSTILNRNGTAPIDKEADKESKRAVEYLMKHGSVLPKDVLVFYADYADCGWVTSRKTFTQVDSTVFAYTVHK